MADLKCPQVPKLVAATPKEEKMMFWPETFSEYQPMTDAKKVST